MNLTLTGTLWNCQTVFNNTTVNLKLKILKVVFLLSITIFFENSYLLRLNSLREKLQN